MLDAQELTPLLQLLNVSRLAVDLLWTLGWVNPDRMRPLYLTLVQYCRLPLYSKLHRTMYTGQQYNGDSTALCTEGSSWL